MVNALSDIQKLSYEVSRLEKELADTQRRESKLARYVRLLSARIAFYRFLRRLRSPTSSFELWPLGAILVTATLCAVVVFLLLSALWDSGGMIAICVILTAAIGGGSMAICFYYPDDATLSAKVSRETARLEIDCGVLATIRQELSELRNSMVDAKANREKILASARYRREQLLLRNWKAMRDTEWEEYLAEVFRALGGRVQMTNKTGDQGVDLVVELAQRRIAVQAKGYHNSVSNSAVQEAVAGKAHYQCNACAVITNSRFTRSAQELAESNDCCLIGEYEFAKFVRGETVL